MKTCAFALAALAIAVAIPAFAQEQNALPPSGSFKSHGGFKWNGDSVEVAKGHTLMSGLIWGATITMQGAGRSTREPQFVPAPRKPQTERAPAKDSAPGAMPTAKAKSLRAGPVRPPRRHSSPARRRLPGAPAGIAASKDKRPSTA